MRVLNSSELSFISGGDGVCTAGPNGEVISSTMPTPTPTNSAVINAIYDTITFPIEVFKALIDSLQEK